MLPAFMESPYMASIIDSSRRSVRPSRWAFKFDGLELSRADLIRRWHIMTDAAHILPASRVYFYEGDGCRSDKRRGGRDGREVRTLRELLTLARIDYTRPQVSA